MDSRLSKFSVNPVVFANLRNHDLSEWLAIQHGHVISKGAYSNVFKGTLLHPGGSEIIVAVKCMRFYLAQDIKLLFEKEIYVWSKLKHENILPLLGYAFEKDSAYPLLISPWMDRGTAWEYVTEHRDFNPLGLIVDTARGLKYLHGRNVCHSDIKGRNILVSNSDPPKALISDFGTARMVQASLSLGRSSYTANGTMRWMAHELFTDLALDQPRPLSKETDVWAFGMTIYELFTRNVPYHTYNDFQVFLAILRGELPSFPEHLPGVPTDLREFLISLCMECWNRNPTERITISTVVKKLESHPYFQQIA